MFFFSVLALRFLLVKFTKEIHFRLLLTAFGLESPLNGISWIEKSFLVVAAGFNASTDRIKPLHDKEMTKRYKQAFPRGRHNHLQSPFCTRAVFFPTGNEILRLLMAKTRERKIAIEIFFFAVVIMTMGTFNQANKIICQLGPRVKKSNELSPRNVWMRFSSGPLLAKAPLL